MAVAAEQGNKAIVQCLARQELDLEANFKLARRVREEVEGRLLERRRERERDEGREGASRRRRRLDLLREKGEGRREEGSRGGEEGGWQGGWVGEESEREGKGEGKRGRDEVGKRVDRGNWFGEEGNAKEKKRRVGDGHRDGAVQEVVIAEEEDKRVGVEAEGRRRMKRRRLADWHGESGNWIPHWLADCEDARLERGWWAP